MSTTTTICYYFQNNNRKTPPQNNSNELMQVSQTHTRHTSKPQNHKQILLVLVVVRFPIPDWCFPGKTITFQEYFWYSQFDHSKRNKRSGTGKRKGKSWKCYNSNYSIIMNGICIQMNSVRS